MIPYLYSNIFDYTTLYLFLVCIILYYYSIIRLQRTIHKAVSRGCEGDFTLLCVFSWHSESAIFYNVFILSTDDDNIILENIQTY